MTRYRDTYAKINLGHIRDNVDAQYAKVHKPMIAIIKANAYGHGYKEVASLLKDHPHIAMFAVATLKEAVDLRHLGVTQDILILGAVPVVDLKIAVENDISLTLFSFEYLQDIYAHHVYEKPVKVHIGLDTGMNRIGLKSRAELDRMMRLIDPKIIDVQGVFTHFATADMPSLDHEYEKQLALFKTMIAGYDFKYVHCDNSAAMMYHDSQCGNLCRIGISMYGLDPSGAENPELKQAMSLYTKVVMVKVTPKGEKIGYGMTYTTQEDEYIATLPIGYADGFIRANQGREVYINGKFYPIVGRVCMDQMMVRVDETVKAHDVVEIFGEHISLSRMARELNTISYEIVCLISPRVERVYEDA